MTQHETPDAGESARGFSVARSVALAAAFGVTTLVITAALNWVTGLTTTDVFTAALFAAVGFYNGMRM